MTHKINTANNFALRFKSFKLAIKKNRELLKSGFTVVSNGYAIYIFINRIVFLSINCTSEEEKNAVFLAVRK